MGKFINPFTDYGFKKIFGQEITKDLLIDFLNDLLEGERFITDLTFLNTAQIPELETTRGIIYDIYCTTDTGERIIVEMQNRAQLRFKERALYYLSHAIAAQGKKGSEWQFDIKAVYGVFFMNFVFDNCRKVRTDVILSDRETGEQFTDKMRQTFIALPLFDKEEDECETNFERWIYTLKNMETLNRLPFKARKAVFDKLEQIASVASFSQQELESYEQSVNDYRTHLCVMGAARQEGLEEGRAEGMAEGMKKGREEGLEEGLKKGLEKGRAEGEIMKARIIALNLKQKGIDSATIAEVSGLSKEEVERL